MTSPDELAKEAKILDLFDSYPSANPSADTLRAYCRSVESLSLEAVSRSVKQFGDGLVDRPNRDFAPSAESFAANVREWQRAIDQRNGGDIELHNGLIECDWGSGRVDLRGLTQAEQDIVMAGKGIVNGKNLAYLSLPEIKSAITQGDLAAVEGGKTFSAPRLGRIP